ncbi:hypothetical protein [Streptomyces sp. NPDC047985]|uniref:hypothetical protein n=1 Tax=Streptomyces sp. NPDC047985 TaxID=3155384 RepID=UPI00342ACB3C
MTGPFLAGTYAGDSRTTVQLGGALVGSPRLALRWLRGQAVRITNGLDPKPGTPWIPPYVLRPGQPPLLAPTRPPATVPAFDAPTELRAWAADDERQTVALQHLAPGREFEFVARDEACWYGLTARPLVVTQPTPVPRALIAA